MTEKKKVNNNVKAHDRFFKKSSREAHCNASLSHHRTSDVAYGGLRFVFSKSRAHGEEVKLLKVAQIESLVRCMG
jgi:hypothetical protein